jgi:hypothetical protein
MGDIVLAGSATVPDKAREIVAEALARKGYQVGGSGAPVSVDIRQFWGWMTPGFWAIDLEARIDAVVTIGGRRVRAEGYGKNSCQSATSGNWKQAYERAVDDLLNDLGNKL